METILRSTENIGARRRNFRVLGVEHRVSEIFIAASHADLTIDSALYADLLIDSALYAEICLKRVLSQRGRQCVLLVDSARSAEIHCCERKDGQAPSVRGAEPIECWPNAFSTDIPATEL